MRRKFARRASVIAVATLYASTLHADNPAQSGPRIAVYSGIVSLAESALLTPVNQCCQRSRGTQWSLAATAQTGQEIGALQLVAKEGQRCDANTLTFEVSGLLGDQKSVLTGTLLRKPGSNLVSGLLTSRGADPDSKRLMVAVRDLPVPASTRCK